MEPIESWRDFKTNFEKLVFDAADFYLWRNELCGSSMDEPSIRNTFCNLADRAGNKASGTAEPGRETWWSLLREKLQPVNDQYFSTSRSSGQLGPRYLEIPLSRIDPPRDRKPEWRDETSVASLIRLIEGADSRSALLIVEPGDGDRYLAIPEDRVKYAECVTRKLEAQWCVVHEPRAAGRRVEQDDLVINQVCRASVELCDLLETEAHARELAPDRPAQAAEVARFPRRAAWLRMQMRKRGHLTAHRLAELGGPDEKTIKKILDGHPVRDVVIEKLAAVLSSEEEIGFRDIPSA